MAGEWRIITHKNNLPKLAAEAIPEGIKIVHKAAFDIEGNAKLVVPVDTGNLKNSIQSFFENGGLTGVINAGADYAAYVEFGTRRARAQPYMLPAFRKVEPSFLKAWETLFRRYD